jgi:hypothetical protein
MDPNPRRRNWPQKAPGPQNSAASARQQYERYLGRAREARLAGDVVEIENCYQHAEHYLRVMRGAGDEVQEMRRELSYKTHILIGVGSNGVMTVIADWPHLPKQAEVQDKITKARDGYVTFALCTPTSILPASGNQNAVPKRYGPGRGL